MKSMTLYHPHGTHWNFRRARRLIAFLAVAWAVAPAQGAFLNFDNGSGNTNWASATNWNPNSLPTFADYATVENGHTVNVSSAGNRASYIDVLGGATLNITDGSLNFGNANNRYFWIGFNSPGTVNQSGGIVTGTGNNTDLVIDSQGTYNMTGGQLNLSDDVWLLDGAVFSISGNAIVNVGDDLGVPNGASATLQVVLTGTESPLIVVDDDLRLLNELTLIIDTTAWNGPDEVQLFEVNGTVFQDFAEVIVDGQPLAPEAYSFAGSAFVVLVPEPASMLSPGIAMLAVLGLRRRR
jgi:hypothetical protein